MDVEFVADLACHLGKQLFVRRVAEDVDGVNPLRDELAPDVVHEHTRAFGDVGLLADDDDREAAVGTVEVEVNLFADVPPASFSKKDMRSLTSIVIVSSRRPPNTLSPRKSSSNGELSRGCLTGDE